MTILQQLDLLIKLLYLCSLLLVFLFALFELIGYFFHFHFFPLAITVVLLRQAFKIFFGLHEVGLQLL